MVFDSPGEQTTEKQVSNVLLLVLDKQLMITTAILMRTYGSNEQVLISIAVEKKITNTRLQENNGGIPSVFL